MLLRGHRCQAAGVVVETANRLVGETVQFHYSLALDIKIFGATKDLRQTGMGCVGSDKLTRQGQIIKQIGECTGSFRVDFLFIKDVPFYGYDFGMITGLS